MRQVQRLLFAFAAVAIIATVSASVAAAQAVTLQEQLSAQYKLVRMGSDSGGVAVVEPGRAPLRPA